MSQVLTRPNRQSPGLSVIDRGIPRRSWIAYLAERQEVGMAQEERGGAPDEDAEEAHGK